jgi:radical SAM superfamily enzyme YgiQ (UPF0313 family)
MNVVLISTYEMGRQPFGLASPAAWLRETGADVICVDLSRQPLPDAGVRTADLIAFHVPMHTATRLAVALLPAVREMNPRTLLCFYGLYAPVNATYLRRLGVDFIFGGEFEQGLASLVAHIASQGRGGDFSPGVNSRKIDQPRPSRGGSLPRDGWSFGYGTFRSNKIGVTSSAEAAPSISLARQKFRVPDRSGLASLDQYARLRMPGGESRTVGYTEASRGCKHLCRHCPIVPVYNGAFRVVDREVVLEDIRRQVVAGARHITFGDPDFFNGIGHAIPLVEALRSEFPHLTYDVTIKIEHLLKHRDRLPRLRDTGCLFVTSAVESVDDAVLDKLAKNHTRADFLRVVALFREIGLALAPTFVAFTPWTTLGAYCDLLETVGGQDLVENVAPIQLAIRLLIPAGSRLLELPDVQQMIEPFDQEKLVYPWRHADPRVDALCERLQEIVHTGERTKVPRARIFECIEEAANKAAGRGDMKAPAVRSRRVPLLASRATIPYLNEPWYC